MGTGAELTAAAGADFGGGVAAASGGLTVGGAATGVLAGIALGFTIYGGLRQERNFENIALNTVSGAASGAVLGAVIGSVVPGVGTAIGAVIGAIAGGAAAGGTTGLKAPRRPSSEDLSGRVAVQAADNLGNAIASATSIEDLVEIFNRRWAPHGEVRIATVFEGVTYDAGDFDDPARAAATPALMVIPEFLDSLVITVGPTGRGERNQTLIDKFRGKRDELLETLSNIPFGILESDQAAGITRRTYLPFQELYRLQPGRNQLFGSGDLYRRDLGGDEATVAFLLDRLREYSVRRDIDIARQDFLYRQ